MRFWTVSDEGDLCTYCSNYVGERRATVDFIAHRLGVPRAIVSRLLAVDEKDLKHEVDSVAAERIYLWIQASPVGAWQGKPPIPACSAPACKLSFKPNPRGAHATS